MTWAEMAVIMAMKSGIEPEYFTRKLNLVNLNAFVQLHNNGMEKVKLNQRRLNNGMMN